jgi:hypothetical protein
MATTNHLRFSDDARQLENDRVDSLAQGRLSGTVRYILKRISWLVVLGIITSGCSITADGIGPAHRAPDSNKVTQIKEQLQENAASSAPATPWSGEGTTPNGQPGILVVGTTGPFRSINDKDRGGFYAAYLKAAGQWHPGEPPAMDAAAFQEKLAGWASIQTFGIPGIASVRLRMLVPTSVAHETQFASAAGSFLFGTTGDLVVARSDRDGLLWLERVLCHDNSSYHACAKDYQAGVFDQNSGQALGRDRKPKASGVKIDVVTYLNVAAR